MIHRSGVPQPTDIFPTCCNADMSTRYVNQNDIFIAMHMRFITRKCSCGMCDSQHRTAKTVSSRPTLADRVSHRPINVSRSASGVRSNTNKYYQCMTTPMTNIKLASGRNPRRRKAACLTICNRLKPPHKRCEGCESSHPQSTCRQVYISPPPHLYRLRHLINTKYPPWTCLAQCPLSASLALFGPVLGLLELEALESHADTVTKSADGIMKWKERRVRGGRILGSYKRGLIGRWFGLTQANHNWIVLQW